MVTVSVAFSSFPKDAVGAFENYLPANHPPLLSIEPLLAADDLAPKFLGVATAVANFMLSSVAVTIGIVLLVAVVWIYRRFIGEGAIGFSSIAERVLGLVRPERSPKTVNVEYRDASGRRMDLGPYIHVATRARRGGAYVLQAGVFVDCDPASFTPGAIVDINVQQGMVREEAVVRMDFHRNLLFVQSVGTFDQMISKIHRHPTPGQAAE